jgi:transcription antitermination factor NusG
MATRKVRRKYRPSSHSHNVSGKSRIVRRALTHRREIDHGKQWFCVRTSIGCARRAELGLRAAGFDVFRPVDDRWRVHKHRCSDASLGWFGRYLFVGFERIARFATLRETDGVESVLGVAGTPLAVRPEVLQAVADQIAGYRKTPPAPFKEGQDVLVQAGPFAELRGIVEEADEQSGRASVAIEMFGKTHVQELDFLDLKAA